MELSHKDNKWKRKQQQQILKVEKQKEEWQFAEQDKEKQILYWLLRNLRSTQPGPLKFQRLQEGRSKWAANRRIG